MTAKASDWSPISNERTCDSLVGGATPSRRRHDRAVPGGLAYRRLMVRMGAIVLQVSDTDRAGAFWSQALGYQRGTNQDFLSPSEGGLPRLHLDETGPHPPRSPGGKRRRAAC